MIVVDSGPRSERGFAAVLRFADQLARRGHDAVVDARTAPADMGRTTRYPAAPYLADIEGAKPDTIVIIGGESLSDETLRLLSLYQLEPDARVLCIGRFASRQSLISSQSRIAFAIGYEPAMLELQPADLGGLTDSIVAPLFAVSEASWKPLRKVPEVFVFVPAPVIEAGRTLPALGILAAHPELSVSLIVPGGSQDRVRGLGLGNLPIHGISDVQPAAFADRADIAVILGEGNPGENMTEFAVCMMAAGKPVVDCTDAAALIQADVPAVRGPQIVEQLASYLIHTVVPNAAEIGENARTSRWIANHSITRLEELAGLTASPRNMAQRPPSTLFVPTNGSGLGHARRSSVIAAEMQGSRHRAFAAFPSCIPLVSAAGFSWRPLVQRTPFHADDFANDILNYLRLRNALAPGDTLVFDGNYVFDSIFRVVFELQLPAVWIRRGLWQPGQTYAASVGRENIFRRVIVPGEAFAELNTGSSFGPNIHRTGPIVGRSDADPAAIRSRLAEMAGRDFTRLVVTMLGGGIAADRSAQLQVLANLLERRPDLLHLVIVWPGSPVSPSLHGWKNTIVARTVDALAYARAADFVVSASGYNSFHELLYHGVPTIFVPQMAPIMDDQERRARAASDRGLARTVLAHEMLKLSETVGQMLDGDLAAKLGAALGDAGLPEIGNALAARLVAEVEEGK